MKQKVLGELYAEWVNVRSDKSAADFETFLRETDVLNRDDATKSKRQKIYRKIFFESMVVELFADWVGIQRAQGRDERELVFGAFVSEEGYLVPDPAKEAICQT